jgi:hypothetical protein
MKRYWWKTGSGRIELHIAMNDARTALRSRPCNDDIASLRNVPYLRRQLAKISPSVLLGELREYGAWNNAELADHDANLTRLLWLACCDVAEGQGGPVEVDEVTL